MEERERESTSRIFVKADESDSLAGFGREGNVAIARKIRPLITQSYVLYRQTLIFKPDQHKPFLDNKKVVQDETS